jgi:hypothetical protein
VQGAALTRRRIDPVSVPLLPGSEFVEPGLRDLEAGLRTDAALVVLAAAPRLRRAGVAVPESDDELQASRRLYLSLAQQVGVAAHSRHHAMMRRVVSYASARARSHQR